MSDRAPKSDTRYVRVAALKNAEAFKRHLTAGGIDLGFDETLLAPSESPFARPFIGRLVFHL